MKLFFTKKELHLRKKRLILMAACLVVVIGLYVVLTWPKKVEPEAPLVIVEPVGVENVEIYGEYVGRIYMCANAAPQYVAREYLRHDGEEKQ